ncbi:ABC transporter ATP-binding protein [Methylobrevis sp. L22]|uniref:ABC transporter ATP-binding protein n=2 Tax=Methylobrevis albus TaxID=2793297 RepID=A0A931MZE3_9HYPH|nr:ABC transporter ATP-binding protein [Methylobrevis albus]MBH0237656.1 ABC transporter ATP-binding protein [Methylobrevis albus]
MTAVDDVSFSVAAGEAYGLVGESGSGKSTILRAITGLVRPSAGTISIAGEAISASGRRPAGFYRSVQMVFQDPYGSLHPRRTVDQTLAEPLAIHSLADREARIVGALAEVGLGDGFRFRYPHQLSGGQRQRVAIARALILRPRLLLLDEPTSALDVSVQAEILNLLERLRAELGLAYVLVSHDLAVVGHLCDRLAILRRGRVVEEAGADALRGERLASAYGAELIAASRGFRRPGTPDPAPDPAPAPGP